MITFLQEPNLGKKKKKKRIFIPDLIKLSLCSFSQLPESNARDKDIR